MKVKNKTVIFLAILVVLTFSGCLSWISFWVALPDGLFEPVEIGIPSTYGVTVSSSETMELPIPSVNDLSQELELPLNPYIDDIKLYLNIYWETTDSTPLSMRMYLSITDYSEAEADKIVDAVIEPNQETTIELTTEIEPIANLLPLMNENGGAAYLVSYIGAATTAPSTITLSFSGEIKVSPFSGDN
ncbi:MAG: hypothetical protein PWQ27_1742 [Kosmotoga sp.]|nr:hypothetical protein [Kosmotoga sp.]